MFDSKKRTTLKVFTGVSAAASIPTSLMAASKAFSSLGADTQEQSVIGSDVDLTLVSGHGRWHSVKLTNTSNKAITLKHVYPGIVSISDNKYDINTLFSAGPLVLEPGASHVGVVAQTDANALEVSIPEDVTQLSSLSVKTDYLHFGKPQQVVTTRSFFA